jgi:3-hydroxyisobutyrate dehydrogenase-like beta-hydroxyacid dehydrogenase
VSAAASGTRVGWIGIGRMGYAMAERRKSGADLTA